MNNRKYYLKCKETDEVYHSLYAEDINDAINKFANLKLLTPKQLLSIYNVT